MARLLVFGDDGSIGADTAWGWVCNQDWNGWAVKVVSVAPLDADHPEPEAPQPAPPTTERMAPPEARFSSIEHAVGYGKPQEVLANVPADLLVIGPRGRGWRKKARLGSVAEALIQAPSAPVVIARQICKVEQVILAVDGSSHAQAATDMVGSMPWAHQVAVTVMCVDAGDGHGAGFAQEAIKRLEGKVRSLEAVVPVPRDIDITVNVRHSIEEHINQNPCQLVVMGTQGLHGLKRLYLGSVASHVTHHVESSVLLVRDNTIS